MTKKIDMITKASIATGVFGVTSRTLRGWHEPGGNGVPGRKRDAFFAIIDRRARREGQPINGTPKHIKDKLCDPEFVLHCLMQAFPRVWE